jgi:DNA-binding transcriptional regulator YdaS (Cro superfamily)
MELVGIEALKTAVGLLGSQKALAKAISRPQSRISEVINLQGKIPAEWCLPIEQVTGGKVTRHQLRPDLYPAEAA